MKLIFSEHAWDDYLYWQRTDRKILQRINMLITESQRTPFVGIGKTVPSLELFHGLLLTLSSILPWPILPRRVETTWEWGAARGC